MKAERAAFVASAAEKFSTFAREGTVDARGVKLRCFHGGEGEPLVLLHGWPETARAWRHVAPELMRRRSIYAFDLPGLGHSESLAGGHEVHAAARAIHAACEALELGGIDLVGHDVGGMVAFAFALQRRESVKSLSIIEAPLPGIGDWGEVLATPRLWHFGFHSSAELPETLTRGRERDYLEFFFRRDTVVKDAFLEDDLAHYSDAYARPGRMANGFDYYRGLQQTASENRKAIQSGGPLAIPVLAVGGAASNGLQQADRLRSVANDVHEVVIDGAGHFIAEERPEVLAAELTHFLKGS